MSQKNDIGKEIVVKNMSDVDLIKYMVGPA